MSDGTRPLRFVVVGAGMAGILAVVYLRERGFDDIAVYEKADRLGGTWRENTYPGVTCDVPSILYSYSFAPNPEWSHRFSSGSEIQSYLEGVARRHDVERSITYGEEVVHAEHDGDRWHLLTTSGLTDVADVVIAATGVFHHPFVPGLEGLEDFAGDLVHTARWDASVPLTGRRVGIIGTGSSAIQTVGAVVDEVASLSLFQRTAQWVLPQDNPPYTDEEKAAFRADPDSQRRLHDEISELFADGFANAVVDAESPVLARIAELCQVNLDSVVDDELRERLTPDHRAACKRLVVSENFYEAIQHPNARLVTTGIDRIVSGGVLTENGEVHELDVLVLATGFQVDQFMRPMEIIGPAGNRLSEAWAERPTAYLSIAIPGLPNLFMLNGPNGPVGNFSLIEVAELQMEYALQLVDRIADGSCRLIEPTADATEAHEEARTEAAGRTVWATGCNSWYLDDRGVPMAWPWTFREFRRRMATPELDHYLLTD
ncbi:MAG: NAD(P)/FAD-dependent oxidoreductase [Acidimicrobiales bacterium]|nr:NAD(P)/FAD-dependent oxidoreductase [Acidimicrobiales bacterium]